MIDRPRLKREEVERASRREDIFGFHPLIAVLERNSPQILQLNAVQPPNEDTNYKPYLKRNFGFLADAVIAAEEFTLEPLDMIAVWSKVSELFPIQHYHRYAFATMMLGAHSTQGMDISRWGRLAHYYLDESLPDDLVQDRNGLTQVWDRLKPLHKNLSEITLYMCGVRSPGDTGIALAQMIMRGTEDQKKQAEAEKRRLRVYREKHYTQLLDDTTENIGTGLNILAACIEEAYELGDQK